MANTTADKLAHLQSIKNGLKTSINGSGNIVGDVFADYPGAVDDLRSKIATAITAKGVATNATDTPDQMAANIGSIQTGQSYEETTEFSTFASWLGNRTESDKFGVIVSVFDSDSYITAPIFAGFSWIEMAGVAEFGSTNISIAMPTLGTSFFYAGQFVDRSFELRITDLDNHDNIVYLACDAGAVIAENNSRPELFSFTFFAIR